MNLKIFLSIISATIWISISEFVRNEILLKQYWTDHYNNLGLNFPSSPINGAIWGLWSLLFAILIKAISLKFSMLQTIFISWFAAFVMMWVVVWNMSVFPIEILTFAFPLSLLETFLATWITFKLAPTK